MKLELDELQVLPDGVHECSLEELQSLFGRFQGSDRRMRLFDKLKEYVEELHRAGISGSIIVDGSFVMQSIDEPDDIDLVLVLSDNWDMKQDLQPFQYNLVSKRSVQRRFPFDVFPVREDSAEEAYWIEFFSKVNIKWYQDHGFPDGATKGLARISL